MTYTLNKFFTRDSSNSFIKNWHDGMKQQLGNNYISTVRQISANGDISVTYTFTDEASARFFYQQSLTDNVGTIPTVITWELTGNTGEPLIL